MVETAVDQPSAGLHCSPRGTESILVVDDESLVRNVCSMVLTAGGYKILLAEEGHAALQMLRATPSPVDLALVDFRMPRMNGPELVVELFDCLGPTNPNIRFILMSGYPDPDIGQLADHRHIPYSFLWKPFTPSVLLGTVRREFDAVHPLGSFSAAAYL